MKKSLFENMLCPVVVLTDVEIHAGCIKSAGTILDVTVDARTQWVADGVAATPDMIGRMGVKGYLAKRKREMKNSIV